MPCGFESRRVYFIMEKQKYGVGAVVGRMHNVLDAVEDEVDKKLAEALGII